MFHSIKGEKIAKFYMENAIYDDFDSCPGSKKSINIELG